MFSSGQSTSFSSSTSSSSSSTSSPNPNGAALLNAAKLGEAAKIVDLLQLSDSNVNHADHHGNSALHYACSMGHFRCIQLLVNNGADLNLRGQHGFTPLMMATQGCRSKSHLEYLVESGADVNVKGFKGETLLHAASMEGNLEGMKFSLERAGSGGSAFGGSGINCGTDDGRTPLHVAAWWCDSAAPLEMLVRAGGNLRKKDRYGQNTLHWAARGGNYDVVKFVLDHDAGNYADSVGQTSAGVDPAEGDSSGKTALDLALSATTVPAPRVVELLRERMRLGLPVCGTCEENPVEVVFKPCGCKIACGECSRRWKKCAGCKTAISEREKLPGVGVSGDSEGAGSGDGGGGGYFRGRPSTATLSGLLPRFD